MEVLALACLMAWAAGAQSEQVKLGISPAQRAQMREDARHEKALHRIAEKHGGTPIPPPPKAASGPYDSPPKSHATVPEAFKAGYRSHTPIERIATPVGRRTGEWAARGVMWAKDTGRSAVEQYRRKRTAAGKPDPAPVLIPLPPAYPPAVGTDPDTDPAGAKREEPAPEPDKPTPDGTSPVVKEPPVKPPHSPPQGTEGGPEGDGPTGPPVEPQEPAGGSSESERAPNGEQLGTEETPSVPEPRTSPEATHPKDETAQPEPEPEAAPPTTAEAQPETTPANDAAHSDTADQAPAPPTAEPPPPGPKVSLKKSANGPPRTERLPETDNVTDELAAPNPALAPTEGGPNVADVTYQSVIAESGELRAMCDDDSAVYGRIRDRCEREIGRGDDLIAALNNIGAGGRVTARVTACVEQYRAILAQLDDLQRNTIAQGEVVVLAKDLLERGQGLYAGIAQDMESVAERDYYVSDAVDHEDANAQNETYELQGAAR